MGWGEGGGLTGEDEERDAGGDAEAGEEDFEQAARERHGLGHG